MNQNLLFVKHSAAADNHSFDFQASVPCSCSVRWQCCVLTQGVNKPYAKRTCSFNEGIKGVKGGAERSLGEDDESSWSGGSKRKVTTWEAVERASGRLMEKDCTDKSLLPGGRYISRNA